MNIVKPKRAAKPTPTVSMSGDAHSNTFSLNYDDGVQRSDNVAYYHTPNIVQIQDHTTVAPIVHGGGIGEIDPLGILSMANVRCGEGHRASPECTEYIDGEMVSTCLGCGERIILPRVPGAVPLVRLNAFIETLVEIVNGNETDYDDSRLFYEYAELKRAIGVETEAMSRLNSLLDIAERIIKAKLAVPPSE